MLEDNSFGFVRYEECVTGSVVPHEVDDESSTVRCLLHLRFKRGCLSTKADKYIYCMRDLLCQHSV